ncbi:hypothetical protein FPJ44_09645 [Mycobacterium tuberculosis]|nr:hypothetical protein FPJ44_09645 [Mycobacterium tuberculosis]
MNWHRHSTQGGIGWLHENNARLDLLPPAMPGRIRLAGKHSHSLKFAYARRTATTTRSTGLTRCTRP